MTGVSRKGFPKVMRNGRLVSKSRAAPRDSAPYVISDNMQALVHPSTGKLMDSKSAFRAVTKDKGCVEVGNETMTGRQRQVDTMPDMRQSISQAMRELGI